MKSIKPNGELRHENNFSFSVDAEKLLENLLVEEIQKAMVKEMKNQYGKPKPTDLEKELDEFDY